MKKYHVTIFEDVPLREYKNMTTTIIESDKSVEELEKEIIEFNRKKGRNVTVHVSEINWGNNGGNFK